MGDKSKIEWTEATWNFLRGCSHVSAGCSHCYAERMASRFNGKGEAYQGLTRAGRWTGEVRFIEDKLDQPIRWRRPRMIFVNSMSDTFHDKVPDHVLCKAFDIMRKADHHIFQVLTKRPERMANFLINVYPEYVGPGVWPFENVWLGTTVENQDANQERVKHLVNTPAHVRFLSCEPLLEEIDLTLRVDHKGLDMTNLSGLWDEPDTTIDWVIVGAESGHGGRKMHQDWVRRIRDSCDCHRVAFFYKQRVKDGKKITMPNLDGVVHDAMPVDKIRGHKIEKQMQLISSEETE